MKTASGCFWPKYASPGVQTDVDDQTRLLVAASGIIPLFYFPDWDFYRLEEVLVYPGAFNGESFAQQGKNRDVLGIVGEGSLNRLMILSKPALLQVQAGNATGRIPVSTSLCTCSMGRTANLTVFPGCSPNNISCPGWASCTKK
ncbi:MAG: zinc-dependent peptidase [Saprospirales bacterium]|nr:zinc-dependent peptidase [Saprospirales bacterium]